jgi:hypothetical protein
VAPDAVAFASIAIWAVVTILGLGWIAAGARAPRTAAAQPT